MVAGSSVHKCFELVKEDAALTAFIEIAVLRIQRAEHGSSRRSEALTFQAAPPDDPETRMPSRGPMLPTARGAPP